MANLKNKLRSESFSELLKVIPDLTDEEMSVLIEKTKGNRKIIPLQDYLTISEMAIYLKVCRSTIWKLTKQGILKPIRLGGKVLYARADIDTYLRKEADNVTA